MMCLRELPPSIGAGPMGTKHLVARMNRSRLPPIQRPMISSVRPRVARSPPSGYASDVSKKSTPASAALSMMANPVASSLCSPNVIVPRQSRDTCSPLRPSLTCSISGTLSRARRARPGWVYRPAPYTTMITLPAGAAPDGLVLVTVCPRRGCLPTTLKPSSISTSRALAKVMPTTSGTGTSAGAVEAGADVAVAVGVAVWVADEACAGAEAVGDPPLAGGGGAAGVATAPPTAGADVLPAPLPEDCGEPWRRNATSDPATSSASTAPITAATQPGRRGRRSAAVRAAAVRVMAMVAWGWGAPPPKGPAQPPPGWPTGG